MKYLLGLTITLGLTAVHAQNAENCKRYVVLVAEEKFQNESTYEYATKLLQTAGLSVVDRTELRSRVGEMALVEMKHSLDQKVIVTLKKISGVTVSCETYYDPKPRITGTN